MTYAQLLKHIEDCPQLVLICRKCEDEVKQKNVNGHDCADKFMTIIRSKDLEYQAKIESLKTMITDKNRIIIDKDNVIEEQKETLMQL
eukprot:CAMPEP_0170551308 /NCGR_PEP_ID=MMETSP0211-20121228/9335_1 /TAXON_ID=311385 /ORGANISM="Pseudokeronopsis sp., Strain OXSARD2" /LENGTH=87 /DNA_ID=CAMNT_0010858407 /DNA_START=457 /DNA_END=720 /DNA_ORIENTATION=-